jgi:predicted regulator of Ras-like GTPase activity (Roadblock/LC7/MglB family)
MTDVLRDELARYRHDPGIKAALFVSGEGLLITSVADDDVDVEAVAAQLAGVVLAGTRLATELGQSEARFVTLELDRLNVVVAPFDDDVLLVLIGGPDALDLDYSVRGSR